MSASLERKSCQLVTLAFLCVPARGFAEEMVVDSVRPLAEAVKKLEAQFQVPITYEDPLYQHSEDIQDDTEIVARSKPSDGKRIMGMKVRKLRFAYPDATPSRTPETQAELAVQSALEANNRDKPPGVFEVRRAGGRLHVYPKQVKDQSGQHVAHTSLLDWPISIEPEDRTVLEFIDLLCVAVSKASGTTVQANVGWTQQRTTLGGQNKTARDLLLELLIELENRDPGYKYTWALLTNPSVHQFVLNLRTLHFPSTASTPKVSPAVNSTSPTPNQKSTTTAAPSSNPDAQHTKPLF